MHVRLTVYSEIFINITLTLDEAAAIMDAAEVAHDAMPTEVVLVTDKLRNELDAALRRAMELQRKKEE
jgi:hypothetical protein